MIKKILDYYYLVLLRGLGKRSDNSATALMALTFSMNLLSFIILLDRSILEYDIAWICLTVPA